jgi:hypothetical protein
MRLEHTGVSNKMVPENVEETLTEGHSAGIALTGAGH